MLVLGIDEAGRGPVVGSMFIAGVLVSEENEKKLKELGVKDSKMLSEKQRERLRKHIERLASEIHFVEITASEIDQKRKYMSLNELEALKISELIETFKKKARRLIIDCPDPTGTKFMRRIDKYVSLEKLGLEEKIVEHKADVNYPSVSAASIIAKTERDRHVKELEKKFKIVLRTGYSHDPAAIAFLENHKGEFPEFVRKSWDTAKRIKNKKLQKKLLEWD